jgi:hypothetical protein
MTKYVDVKTLKKEFVTLTVIILLLLATVAPLWIYTTAKASSGDAFLTGNVYDYGEDTDSDDSYNYLVVDVEANVTVAGTYRLQVNRLKGEHQDEYLWLFVSNETYLEEGIQNITVSFNGIAIHGRRINITKLVDVYFYDAVWNSLSIWSELNLTRTYDYTLFDVGATFTGAVVDAGVDADGNGLYDYLDIGIEVDVEDAGLYAVYAYNLANASYYYINVYDYCYMQVSLSQGVYYVNFSIYGPAIYASYVTNISTINWLYLDLKDEQTYSGYRVDERYSLPLNNTYDYTDFESHAQLTGKIVDEGVDTDGNGFFDYLKVGVEINVTETGYYGVVIERLVENETSDLDIIQRAENQFDLGNHTIYFEYYGPMFAYEHFSPANLSDIRLYEVNTGAGLGYLSSASLSHRYNYMLFDTPSKDMQLNFIVYPNGTTGVNGTFNFTHMYPQNMGPQVNTTLSISTVGETTMGSANGTVIFPKDGMFRWPFDSVTANFASKYNNGLLNATLDATVFMPPEGSWTYPVNASDFSFSSIYSNGLLDVSLWGETEIPLYYSSMLFPLNITDFTVLADYMENKIEGNITFHAVPGFPLGDVRVDFNGNKTDLHLTGNVNITYGSFFGMEINSTILEQMLAQFNDAIPGPTGLVYNATWGLLECTQLNTTKTEWSNGLNGTDIEYNATIHGNFTGFFARLLAQMINPYDPEEAYPTVYAALDSALSTANASLILTYYHTSEIATLDLHLASDVKALWNNALQLVPPSLPPSIPPEYKSQIEALLKIANATAYAIQDFSLNASYSSTAQRLDLDAWLLANMTQLENDIIPILPDTVPLPLREIVRSYANTTYCTLTSSNVTFTYVNGTANFDIDWIQQGDFKAQINHEKRFYIDYLNATTPWMLTWQYRLLNETEVNINNFEAEFKIAKDWMHITFNGLIIQPPRDEIDFIRFKLYRLFNMTSEDPYEPPREFEKLKIVITGGFNGTHTILLYAPGTVPNPDTTSYDYKTMTWQNVSLSRLREINFRIAYQGIVDYLGTTYYVPIFTNSTVSNFNFNPSEKSLSFNVSGTTGTGFSEITIPRALVYAALANWTVKIDGNTLAPENFDVTENAEYVFIRLNYSHSEHLIEIIGTWVIVEFQPNILPIILAMLSLIATVIAIKQRKKLGKVTTRYQGAIHAFANKLHQLTT